MNCLHCKKILINNNKSTRQAKYCSLSCLANKRQKDYIDDWLIGKITGGTGYQLSKRIRRWILKRDQNQCIICGWSEMNSYSETYPLVVDHIDGNPMNHNHKNLRTICPNCDSLTSTYKALNKGYGRKARTGPIDH